MPVVGFVAEGFRDLRFRVWSLGPFLCFAKAS